MDRFQHDASDADRGPALPGGIGQLPQLLGDGTNTYSYDPAGNRTGPGYVIGANNELLSDGTYNYTYDADGNETSKTTIATGDEWTYSYNAANEMIGAVETTASGTIEQTVAYQYDVFGNLIEQDVTSGGVTTVQRFAYDNWDPAKPTTSAGNANDDVLAELNGDNALVSRYLNGDGVNQHFARVDTSLASDPAGVYWTVTDREGSTRVVLDNSGAVKDTIQYGSFGNITSETAPPYRGLFAWTGCILEVVTGLQYNHARWYDPTTGRWLALDPDGFAAGDTDLYRYVGDDPTNMTDPSGLAWLSEFVDGAWEGTKAGATFGLTGPVGWAVGGYAGYEAYQHNDPSILTESAASIRNGALNMAKGIGKGAWDLTVGLPDVAATAVDAGAIYVTGTSTGHKPWTYYGASSQAQQDNGVPASDVAGEYSKNFLSFGIYGYYQAAQNYAQTGDPTAFQEATGPLALNLILSAKLGPLVQAELKAAPLFPTMKGTPAEVAAFSEWLNSEAQQVSPRTVPVEPAPANATPAPLPTPAEPPPQTPNPPLDAAPVRPLAGVLEAHPTAPGFTGVFDSATGRIGLNPSTAAEVLPPGYVARAGGHATVSEALGGNAANHSGFAVIPKPDGTLRVTWRSGTLNTGPGNEVPAALRPRIITAIEEQTGRIVSEH